MNKSTFKLIDWNTIGTIRKHKGEKGNSFLENFDYFRNLRLRIVGIFKRVTGRSLVQQRTYCSLSGRRNL
jgi:hypothetical protein